MKPIKISYNRYAHNQYKTDLRRLERLLNDFFAIADKYVKTEDKNSYKGNLYKTFLTNVEEKYRVNFPIISVEKMCDFLEIPLHQLSKISNDVKAVDVEIDYNTLKAQEPDFSVYATTKDEIEKVHELQPLLKELNKLILSGVRVYPMDICRGLGGRISYDTSENTFIPSTNYILHSHRILG
jgi:hypothetical protein